MKVINIKDYYESMGILIDVRHPLDYQKEHDKRSINIYVDKLLASPQKYLSKDRTYYIICKSGYSSKRAVRFLSFLNYDVVQVVY